MKTTKKSLILLAFLCVSQVFVSATGSSLFSTRNIAATGGPGLMAGLDFSFGHSRTKGVNGNTSVNYPPTNRFSVMPNVLIPVTGQWGAQVGLGYSLERRDDDAYPIRHIDEETYYGMELGAFRWCEDPCEPRKLHSFLGANFLYYGGNARYTTINKLNNNDEHTTEGKISEMGAGLFGGA